MTTPNLLVWAGAALSGAVLGALFFGGLRWTVQRGLQSAHPGLWFVVSFAVRTGLVVAGFAGIGQSDWRRLLACAAGFTAARALVLRASARTGGARAPSSRPNPEGSPCK